MSYSTSFDSNPVADIIWDKFILTYEDEDNKSVREKYSRKITNSSKNVITKLYAVHFERFLDSEINKKELDKISVKLYRDLKASLENQVYHGIQMVIVRRVHDKKPQVKIGDCSESGLKEYVETKFWDSELNEVTDPVNYALIIKDSKDVCHNLGNCNGIYYSGKTS